MKYIVAQLGSRMHYAVAKVLAKAEKLEAFYTDFVSPNWASKFLGFFPTHLLPGPLKRILGRNPLGKPSALCHGFQILGLQYFMKLRFSPNASKVTKTFIWAGKTFGKLVVQKGFGGAKAVYGFNSASLEMFKAAKKQGLKCVLEQTIAPKLIEDKLLKDELENWPEWENHFESDHYLREFIDREKEEWVLADQILCGSKFVKESIRKAGGPYKKCVVIPYGVAAPDQPLNPKKKDNGPLRLLTVGAVNLRKGAPWVHQLAESLKGTTIFRWVGPVQLTEKAKKIMGTSIELVGSVPWQDMPQHYDWADSLVLLSICEGSATVIYEALVRGLPVLCTENSGPAALKERGLYVLPAKNLVAAKKKVEELVKIKKNGKPLSVSKKLSRFSTIESYEKRLLSVLLEQK